MMSLLVTGAAGFIGSNFVRLLDEIRPDVRVDSLDKLTYAAGSGEEWESEHRGDWANLFKDKPWKHEGYLHEGDICDEGVVRTAMRGKDAVVHFAAESHVDRSIEGWSAVNFAKTNVLGTTILLVIAREVGVKKFIYVGTDEEYGSIDVGSFNEDDVLTPSSPYSASKAGGSLMAWTFWRSFGLPVVITRSTNNFGPYQQVEKFIPRSITELIEGRNIKLYGTGKNVRDWIYVEDNCRAILAVLEKGQPGEIYNIGAGQEKSNEEIAQSILEQIALDQDRIEYVADRPGHDFRYSVNTTRIKELGWQPQWSFDEGMKSTVQWYMKNQDWWQHQKERTEAFYRKIGR